jgi:hypothetical protein
MILEQRPDAGIVKPNASVQIPIAMTERNSYPPFSVSFASGDLPETKNAPGPDNLVANIRGIDFQPQLARLGPETMYPYGNSRFFKHD